LQLYSSTTVQQYNSTAVLSNSTTIQEYNSTAVHQCSHAVHQCSASVQCIGAVHQCNASVQQCSNDFITQELNHKFVQPAERELVWEDAGNGSTILVKNNLADRHLVETV
jgi:hypothetical protein